MIYVVEMDEWGCRLYGSVGNLLTFVSFCDKNMGVQVISAVRVIVQKIRYVLCTH